MDSEVVLKPINIRPQIRKKFDRSRVEAMIRQIVIDELEGTTYDSAHGSEMTRRIIGRIHEGLRQMPCDRYKFAAHVVLGEKQGQGVKCAGGCLWDDDTDCIVSTSLNLENVYCVATVFAVYCYHYE